MCVVEHPPRSETEGRSWRTTITTIIIQRQRHTSHIKYNVNTTTNNKHKCHCGHVMSPLSPTHQTNTTFHLHKIPFCLSPEACHLLPPPPSFSFLSLLSVAAVHSSPSHCPPVSSSSILLLLFSHAKKCWETCPCGGWGGSRWRGVHRQLFVGRHRRRLAGTVTMLFTASTNLQALWCCLCRLSAAACYITASCQKGEEQGRSFSPSH